MISLRVNTNLPDVIDYVNMLPVQIQAIVAKAVETAKEEVRQDLVTVFGVGDEDLDIEFSFDGQNYNLSVDGINQYQLFNNTGFDMDYVLDYIENKILNRIQSDLDEAGF